MAKPSDLIVRAKAFAHERHQGQTRKGLATEPYITHVAGVVELVTQFGADEETITAAWLHDVVEDCPPTSLADIESVFGARVASIVAELTDDKSLEKAERKRLQVVNASKKSPEACLIKLADKINNIHAMDVSPPKDWSKKRLLDYLDWAMSVAENLPHKPQQALNLFNSTVANVRKNIESRD